MVEAELQASLASDLERMGLRAGDSVLVRCAARSIAPGTRNTPTILRDALLALLGPTGTLVALTFTATQRAGTKKPRAVFNPTVGTVSGGFSSAILADPRHVRSMHPTNSISAIGANASFYTRSHEKHAAPFSWMSRLIEKKGKQVIIGCVEDSPGLSTIHYTQEVLGLADRSLLAGRDGCFIEGEAPPLEWYSRRTIPGCSMGFWKLYGHYARSGILTTGKVGAAYSMLAEADAAHAVERNVLAADPRAALCDRPDCTSCTTWGYNKRALPLLALSIGVRVGRSMARRLSPVLDKREKV